MLKISDYIAMMLSFAGMLFFYLIFAGSLAVGKEPPQKISYMEMPSDFSWFAESKEENPYCIILCGEHRDSAETKEMQLMLSHLKKEYAVCDLVENITEEQLAHFQCIIVTAEKFEELGNVEALFEMVEEGKKVLFAKLPQEQGSHGYSKTIGILRNQGNTTIDGVMIFEPLLVQGMIYHDDLECTVDEVEIDSRCQKLIIEKAKTKKEQKDLIPLLWERKYGEGCFYVVNGDYLTVEKGMGFLTGILAQIEEDFLYPVINAKVDLLDGFPEYMNPYEQNIKQMYSRNNAMFLRDVVWPSLVKIGESNNLAFTGKRYQEVPQAEIANYQYLKGLMEKRGYEIVEDASQQAVEIPFISHGFEFKDEEIMNMQSSISGLGLASHQQDISAVTGKNAGDSKYEWSSYSLELSKLMKALYSDTDWLDEVTLSQANERYKRYLVLKPQITKQEGQIRIETENFNELCFYMLRTKKSVLPGEDYEVQQVGADAYLIKVHSTEILINLME